jgi:hypothetical protein
MSTKVYDGVGKVWLPEPSLSVPGRPASRKREGIVVATVRRPLFVIRDTLKDVLAKMPDVLHPVPGHEHDWIRDLYGKIDPALFARQLVWASIGHNERVNIGAAIQFYQILGLGGTTANGVFTAVAVSKNLFTKTATDLGIGQITGGATITNEWSTIGLTRAGGTAQNYVAASALDGTASGDVVKTFSVTGTGTATGSALFDSTTPTGSHLFVEQRFDVTQSDAVVISGDSLSITWTITE